MPWHASIEDGEGLDEVEFEKFPRRKRKVPIITAVEERIESYCC